MLCGAVVAVYNKIAVYIEVAVCGASSEVGNGLLIVAGRTRKLQGVVLCSVCVKIYAWCFVKHRC